MIIAKNKQAFFDYDILERFEAGIVLEGWEVKSIKAGMLALADSFVKITDKGVFLVNMHVTRWKTQSPHIQINENRERRLLLNQKEISSIQKFKQSSGVTVLALGVHLVSNKIKIEIGVARGRKKYDKREVVKKREIKRDMARAGNRW